MPYLTFIMGKMLKALLVDDEENNLENLAFLLTNDCSGVEVAGKARNAGEARAWLKNNKADVVFLDIQMPGETGFEFLSSLPSYDFKVIFVTAYDQYAIRALRSSAIDYLLKPLSVDELKTALSKIERTTGETAFHQNELLLENLLKTMQSNTPQTKIALPQLGGIIFIEMNDIVSLQADSNYTVIHMRDMQKFVITKTLKEFDELLDPAKFARIHKSYIVNLKHISEYSTNDGGMVKMSDGNQWSVSRRQLDVFLEKMKLSSLMFTKS